VHHGSIVYSMSLLWQLGEDAVDNLQLYSLAACCQQLHRLSAFTPVCHTRTATYRSPVASITGEQQPRRQRPHQHRPNDSRSSSSSSRPTTDLKRFHRLGAVRCRPRARPRAACELNVCVSSVERSVVRCRLSLRAVCL